MKGAFFFIIQKRISNYFLLEDFLVDFFAEVFFTIGKSDLSIASKAALSTAVTTTFLSAILSASDAFSETIALASPTPLDFNCVPETPLAVSYTHLDVYKRQL